MLPYLMTAIAGLAVGIVAMRLWQGSLVAQAAPSPEAAACGDNRPKTAAATLVARIGGYRPTSLHMLAAAGLVLAVAIAVFALDGDDAGTSQRLGGAATGEVPGTAQSLDDVDTMITRLAQRLEDNPDDGEGFRMLGWSYLMTGKPQEALAPFQRALQLLPDDARVHSGYGEALTALADNRVTDEAKSAFAQALMLDPQELRARYFIALWQDQNGQSRDALETWIALASENPADATWQADVRRQIDRVADQLGVDVSNRLPTVAASSTTGDFPVLDPGTISAANQLPEENRQQMVQSMVDGLAARLQANPNDAGGWARLLRSRMVLEQREQAGRDLATARRMLAANSTGLAQVEQVADQLGVPGA